MAVSGDGDDRVFWLEQTRKGCWLTHTLMTGVGQAGALAIADIDKDGKLDIVVPVYEKNALYVLSRK